MPLERCGHKCVSTSTTSLFLSLYLGVALAGQPLFALSLLQLAPEARLCITAHAEVSPDILAACAGRLN